jgi:hypothetical protein
LGADAAGRALLVQKYGGVHTKVHGNQRNDYDPDATSGGFFRYADAAPIFNVAASPPGSPFHFKPPLMHHSVLRNPAKNFLILLAFNSPKTSFVLKKYAALNKPLESNF